MKKFAITISVILVLAKCHFCFAAPEPEIRVLVMDDLRTVNVEGISSPIRITREDGTEQKKGASIRISSAGSKLLVDGNTIGQQFQITNKTRKYKIGSRHFRGTLSVSLKPQGNFIIVDKLLLEDYLSGLINSEISASWPAQSIKAQAVAARTYAMYQIKGAAKSATPRLYDITSTMFDQVYDGAHQEDPRSQKAVQTTAGELLLRGGEVFQAYYHSCCGGHTELAQNVWAGEKGPPVIDDPYCKRSPKFDWEFEIPITEFISTLKENKIQLNVIRTINVTSLTDSPRVDMLMIEDDDGLKMVKATELRRFFGYKNIKSTWFKTNIEGKYIVFRGQGYGHGVGLCQWGAKGMADENIGYRDILKFYYPDANIVKLY